ncbi:MAG: PepSY-associated TM helix domain-containing protein [Pseudomonadota bacterium]
MARKRVFQIARTVHAYAGVALSALLIVVGLSGAFLVFKEDYLRATVPQARIQVDMSLASVGEAANAAERYFGEEDLRVLVFATPDFGLHKAYLTGGRAAYIDTNGDVIDVWEENGRFEEWLFDLHHRLLMGTAGLWILGFSGLVAVAFISAGFFAFWPARKGIRRGLKVASTSRAELLSFHRNLGLYASPIIMLSIVTGVVMAFPQTSRQFFDRFGGPEAPPAESATHGQVSWEAALHTAIKTFPDATPRMAIWPSPGRAARLRLKQPAEWHPNGRTIVNIDPGSGTILYTEDARSLGAGREAYNAIYPIHAAHIGGRVYDAIVFSAGIAVSILGGLGAFTFTRRLLVEAGQRKAKSGAQ